MTVYIGNFSESINLDQLVKEVKQNKGDRRTFQDSYFDTSINEFNNILTNWNDAEYDISCIEWFNYYNGVQFSTEYTKIFSSLVNATPVKVWVSEILPGKCFPYHWDVDTNTSLYVGNKMVRYQMMVEDCVLGHYFVLDDVTLTGYKKGDVYKWNDYKEWHGGGNISFVNKYIYNFLGISND